MEVKTIEHVLHSCAGCGLCESICPTKAIQMIIDEEGFAQPMIDEERCIKCGQCFQRCILQSLKQERQPVEKVYAAFSLSEDIRYHSTSGGIFTEIAQLVLEEFGGVVIGAAYQKDFSVKHELISCVEDIPKLRQSKYIQSDLRDIYKEINKIAEDVTIMFSGTPCQISGLNLFLNKEYENRDLHFLHM